MASKQSKRRLRAKARHAASGLQQLTLEAKVQVQTLAAAPDGTTGLPRISIDAYNGGVIRPSGMFGPVIIDLAGVRKAAGAVPLLLGHDHTAVVGHADVTITDKIAAEGLISGTGQAAQEV